MDHTKELQTERKKAGSFFSDAFKKAFRALFMPIVRTLHAAGATPNAITMVSMVFGIITGIEIARNHLLSALIFGCLMGFSDIVDGQLAREYGLTSRFGGILDSTIDRYNEFFIFTGLGARFHILGEPYWVLLCAFTFANSIIISYVKARAEADGFDCNVGTLQRAERLTIIGFAILFGGLLMKPLMALLAIGTFITMLQRIRHVKKQAE